MTMFARQQIPDKYSEWRGRVHYPKGDTGLSMVVLKRLLYMAADVILMPTTALPNCSHLIVQDW